MGAESDTSGYTFIHNIYGTLKTYLQHMVSFIQTSTNNKGYGIKLFFNIFYQNPSFFLLFEIHFNLQTVLVLPRASARKTAQPNTSDPELKDMTLVFKNR